MKFLIVGRTGRGKDFLVKKLQDRGFTSVKSYTTRKPRTPDEDTHIFIQPEEAGNFTDRVTEAKIGNVEYFATREQVNNADVYVINPNAIETLAKNMPETAFCIIHITADDEKAKEKAIGRAADKDEEAGIFDKRYADEDEEFTAFEHIVNGIQKENKLSNLPENIVQLYAIENDFEDTTLSIWAEIILRNKRKHDNLIKIIDCSIEELEIMRKGADGERTVCVNI